MNASQVAVALGQFQVMLSANPYNAGLMHLAAENAETFVTQLPADVHPQWFCEEFLCPYLVSNLNISATSITSKPPYACSQGLCARTLVEFICGPCQSIAISSFAAQVQYITALSWCPKPGTWHYIILILLC